MMQQTPAPSFIFVNEKYEFHETNNQNTLMKTSLQIKHGNMYDHLSLITKLHHPNMVCLKKVGKSRKDKETQVFWLYYELVPYTLKNRSMNISIEKFQQTVEKLLQYFSSSGLKIQINQINIGVNTNDDIKVYIPAKQIMKGRQAIPLNPSVQLNKLISWYRDNFQSTPSLEPRKAIEKNKVSFTQNKDQKTTGMDKHLESIRNKIRSVEIKFQKKPCKTPVEEKNKAQNKVFLQKSREAQNLQEKIQQNINCINIYHNTNKIVSPPKPPVCYHQFDNDSVDTYQMQLGDDYEMPSLKANTRLRQTALTGGKSWDTLTARAPQKKNNPITESAGQNEFQRLIDTNKRKLNQFQKSKGNKGYDVQTLRQLHNKKPENWRTSTLRSDPPSGTIQQKVQQALAKAKNVMSMLRKNTKSFSLEKV